MSYSNNSAYAQASAASRVAGAAFEAIAEFNNAVRSWVAEMHREHVRRATFRQLNSLDDRTLTDIGLTRDSIHEAVKSLDMV